MSVEGGRKAAETVMLNLLATVKAEVGELSRVARFVKVLAVVNAAPTSQNTMSSPTAPPIC